MTARIAWSTVATLCFLGIGCANHKTPGTGVPPLDAGVVAPADAGVVDPNDAGVGGNGVRRPLPIAFSTRKGIGYSGYRAGQSPDEAKYPSEDQIKEDLALLTRGQWTLLRLWDCSPHAERVLKVIHDNQLDFQVMLGVWVVGPKKDNDGANLDQIDQCVALAAQYPDIVGALSVGNETLDSWSDVRLAPAELADYIGDVRGKVQQPVTTDDFFVPFTFTNDDGYSYADVTKVARAVDFLALHVYAFIDAPYHSFDWKQLAVAAGPARATAMMDAAMQYTKESIGSAVDALAQAGLAMPIVIGETGWKTSPTGVADDATEADRAHPVNQKMFYDRVVAWVYGADRDANSPLTMFYFEAFDEPWKGGDDGWGLFDTDRYSKYTLWDTFADKKPPNAPTYTDADAVYATK